MGNSTFLAGFIVTALASAGVATAGGDGSFETCTPIKVCYSETHGTRGGKSCDEPGTGLQENHVFVVRTAVAGDPVRIEAWNGCEAGETWATTYDRRWLGVAVTAASWTPGPGPDLFMEWRSERIGGEYGAFMCTINVVFHTPAFFGVNQIHPCPADAEPPVVLRPLLA